MRDDYLHVCSVHALRFLFLVYHFDWWLRFFSLKDPNVILYDEIFNIHDESHASESSDACAGWEPRNNRQPVVSLT